MPRTRTIFAVCALLPALFAAACGGGGDEDDVRSLVDRAFKEEIRSAKVALDVQLGLKGIEQLKEPVKLTLNGPYQTSGEGRLPRVDWDLAVNAAGQSFSAGFVSTSDNAFVSFQGTDYEVGRATVAQLNRQLAQASKQGGEKKGLADFGVNPREWLVDAKEEGEEEIAGVRTRHVSSALDVGRFLDDVNKLVGQAGNIPGAGQARQLTDREKQQIEEVVENPRFDLYVGEEDNVIRRLSADIRFEVPEDRRRQLNGLSGGSLRFSIEFREVRRPQRVAAPRNARPISELTSRLGGLGGLGGGSQQGSQQGSQGASPGGGAGAGGDAGFQAYSECLQKADPSNRAALDKCAELLE